MKPNRTENKGNCIVNSTELTASLCTEFSVNRCTSNIETVSLPNLNFSLSKLDQVLNQYFMHILTLITDSIPSWFSVSRRMTEKLFHDQLITLNGSTRPAGVKLATPGSAVGLATNCTTGPGAMCI